VQLNATSEYKIST